MLIRFYLLNKLNNLKKKINNVYFFLIENDILIDFIFLFENHSERRLGNINSYKKSFSSINLLRKVIKHSNDFYHLVGEFVREVIIYQNERY